MANLSSEMLNNLIIFLIKIVQFVKDVDKIVQ